MSEAPTRQAFEGWCVLELMGHRRLGGWVSEATIAGGSFLRIDVPGVEERGGATQFYAPGSIYAITPTTEAIARALAAAARPEPVQEWELPKRTALPAGDPIDAEDFDGDAEIETEGE